MSKFARDIAVKQYLILLLPQEFHNSRGFSNVTPQCGNSNPSPLKCGNNVGTF